MTYVKRTFSKDISFQEVVTQTLIQSLKKPEQVDLFEFGTTLVYSVSSRTPRVAQKNPVSKKQNKINLEKNKANKQNK